jgi:FkbM family methyltransferase
MLLLQKSVKHFIDTLIIRWLKKSDPTLMFVSTNNNIGRSSIVRGHYDVEILEFLFKKLFINKLDSFRGQIAIDVGANVGSYSVYFSNFFQRTIAFEPIDYLAKVVEINGRIKGGAINVLNCALSDREGVLRLYTSKKDLGLSSLHYDSSIHDGEILDVQVKIGDEILEKVSRGDQAIGLIKIDAELHEGHVLHGFSRSIAKHKPILIFEYGTPGNDNNFKEPELLRDFLNNHNYTIFYEIGVRSIPRWLQSRLAPIRFLKVLLLETIWSETCARKFSTFEARYHPLVVALPADNNPPIL